MILTIIHSQDGEGKERLLSMRKRVSPCEGGKLAYSESNASDADARWLKTCMMNQMLMQEWWLQPKNLQSWMSDESDADARMMVKWVPTPWHACISVWCKWNPRLQVSLMSQRLSQLTSKTASFWLWPPILHQHLIHWHPRLQVKISKGYNFFSLWRYLYCLLVPGYLPVFPSLSPVQNDMFKKAVQNYQRKIYIASHNMSKEKPFENSEFSAILLTFAYRLGTAF